MLDYWRVEFRYKSGNEIITYTISNLTSGSLEYKFAKPITSYASPEKALLDPTALVGSMSISAKLADNFFDEVSLPATFSAFVCFSNIEYIYAWGTISSIELMDQTLKISFGGVPRYSIPQPPNYVVKKQMTVQDAVDELGLHYLINDSDKTRTLDAVLAKDTKKVFPNTSKTRIYYRTKAYNVLLETLEKFAYGGVQSPYTFNESYLESKSFNNLSINLDQLTVKDPGMLRKTKVYSNGVFYEQVESFVGLPLIVYPAIVPNMITKRGDLANGAKGGPTIIYRKKEYFISDTQHSISSAGVGVKFSGRVSANG